MFFLNCLCFIMFYPKPIIMFLPNPSKSYHAHGPEWPTVGQLLAEDWLKPGCDIYLIGVEECSYTPRPGFSNCLGDWCDLVQSSLPSLLTLCRHDMGHCQILFLTTERVSKSIHSVVASHEETGLGGLYCNKGGLALSFWIGDNAVCFVSSHLSAHQANVSRRNLDSAHIIEGICLTTDSQRPLTNQPP